MVGTTAGERGATRPEILGLYQVVTQAVATILLSV